ncbi:bicaudal-D-related protein 2-like isoform X3 [Sebastes umbrosus]|uniref:bicaudal-D-related protein 2-like isoform X2 n=1 Tax=Sebastes umbrosus TaxID=72105 RepID=UPI00189FB743|nr:bicaudal-D-related protein 2-like isoform X2 [Sebastes umbrosus]XP_037604421.1 bicaudal-D-related protein 2-like isoform X3 [Sebastes umbrosus]
MEDAPRSPFAILNDRLRPQFTTSDQIYSSLSRIRSKASSNRPTVLPTEPEPKVSVPKPEPKVSVPEPEVFVTEPEDPEEPKDDSEQDDLVSDEENCGDLSDNSYSSKIAELDLKDFEEEEVVDNKSISSCEDKDQPGELPSEGTGHSSESVAVDGEGEGEGDGSSFRRNYSGNLPDVINTSRLLGRRRTLGHVNETLKEVRREVQLSRRRSMKLKAQVDKLQENRDGPGWSQHRETVTEEVLSILRLLSPLTESESSPPPSSPGENRLDKSLSQLQNVARLLAISHTQQSKSGKGKGTEESAILQQAIRDRDDAIEKKRAMEEELLRSKTELMMLNNHLLEAVQKRLELSLELETWREDVQRILHQQCKQQAEQAQKKTSRLGILRRNKQPPIQRPVNYPLASPVVSPTINPSQIFVPRSNCPSPTPLSPTSSSPTPSTSSPTGTQRNWMDRLRRKKADQDAAGQESEGKDDGFQVVSLD